MMSICDIYDALRAKDRPYKAALPVEGALDIIASEVKEGKLDKAYFDLFIEARIYEATRTPSAKSGGAAA
jgi:HD-GYP domain-containing protein (c-di-GMP phosphodiesterase class II)